jgi:DNA-binding MarR family transcriptional regulator
MMPVSRSMTAIVARALAEMEEDITVPQLRVLVLLNSRGPMNTSTVAQHLNVNPSNASRSCDQLVSSGMVNRLVDDADRRNAVLQVTGPAPASGPAS